MLHLQADTLSFTLPGDWSDMSLGQFLAYLAAQTETEQLMVLSGLTPDELRHQPAFDLSRVINQLAYLETIPDWSTWPRPSQLTVDKKTIDLPATIGEMALVGQMWDADTVYQAMTVDDQPPTYLTMAGALLSIFLYPTITGKPYVDQQQASAITPLLETLPVTDALPLAAYLFESWKHPKPSGRITVTTISPVKPKRWPAILGRLWTRQVTTLLAH